MQFFLNIISRNAALVDDQPESEVARILRETADKIEAGRTNGPLYDINGNKVGTFTYTPGD